MNKKTQAILALIAFMFVQLACVSSSSSLPSVSTATSSSPIVEPKPTEKVDEKPRTTPTTKPTATKAPTPTAAIGTSRNNPAPIGSIVTVNDMSFEVIIITRPADSIVTAGNMFNTKPEPNQEYIFVEIRIKCLKDDANSCEIDAWDFAMVGSNGIKYDAEWWLSGVEGLLEDTEFYGGAEITGNLAFIVGIGETNLLLIYEEFFEDPVYLSIE